jgi:hypothetical protein
MSSTPRPPRFLRAAAAVAVAALVVTAACAGTQRLGHYDFRGGTLGVVTLAPAHPEIIGAGGTDLRTSGDAVESLIRIGSEVVREAEMQRFRGRLSDAADRVAVADRMSERVLRQSATMLRATPVTGGAAPDYELEVRIRRYGIATGSARTGTDLVVDADLVLLDTRTGRRIWRNELRARDPIGTGSRAGGDASVENVLTAVNLARMTTEELERHLEILADLAADRMIMALARDLDRTRR